MAGIIGKDLHEERMRVRARIASEVMEEYGVSSLEFFPELSYFKSQGWTEEQVGVYRDMYREAFAEFCRRVEAIGHKMPPRKENKNKKS